jgi:hypothetical protein
LWREQKFEAHFSRFACEFSIILSNYHTDYFISNQAGKPSKISRSFRLVSFLLSFAYFDDVVAGDEESN